MVGRLPSRSGIERASDAMPFSGAANLMVASQPGMGGLARLSDVHSHEDVVLLAPVRKDDAAHEPTFLDEAEAAV